MSRQEGRDLQHALNVFTEDNLLDVAPLIEDGDVGHATRKRVREVKFWLGYVKSKRDDKKDAVADRPFRQLLHHPGRHRSLRHPRWYAWKDAVERGQNRRQNQRKLAQHQRATSQAREGFSIFEGMTVAAWMVPDLAKTRAYNGRHGPWVGRVVSGVRTPEYSEHLCYAMCGSPSCPGRCAGRSSNHNMTAGQGKPAGAVDVSDYVRFGLIQEEIGSPLINRLGAQDPVHFSVTGR